MHRELTAKFLKDELSKMIELFPEEKRAIEYRYEHSLRVASIALDIAKKEGLDEDRCYIGALLHDLGYSVPYDNPKEYVNHGRIGAKLARPFLESLGYSEEEVNEICYGIAIHVDDKADFEGKRTALAVTIGDADNIDRYDAFRIYDRLTWVDYKNLSLEKQKEHVDSVLSSLNKYLDYECATRTATLMWKERISFQLEFYNRLKKQIENSTVKN
ncbi:MAG: HD domain-containing protein [Erysipelotrichaceae bacterium]|nr:HD domain-containing protein [Erysipelotrichaceae bacterium]MDY5652574.1 HD domain-containing protein [Erysipelotrichaceae bacterium]